MNKKKDLKLEITEIFMVKAGKTGWDRCFVGTIKRETDADGSKFVFGKIPVNEYTIIARGQDTKYLGRKLDEMLVWVLDYNMNKMGATISSLSCGNFYLN